jgi:hypothetical protein
LDWHNDITGELPAPRDDEPEHLRKDIADELSDHLHCALNRELHVTNNEHQAKQNVLSRFGNVNRIARQLWFDWMKEKIMSQRLTLAMSAVMTVTCLAVGGFAWISMSQGRVTNQRLLEEGRVSYEKLLETTRSENTELRDTLQALTKRMSPVIIRCLLDKSSGPPGEGFRVLLTGGNPSVFYLETTNSDGIANFGLIPSGNYNILISTPRAENAEKFLGTASVPEMLNISLETKSGESYIKEIVCPSSIPADDVEITMHVEWPEDLREHKLLLFCTFLTHRKRRGRESLEIVHQIPITLPDSR